MMHPRKLTASAGLAIAALALTACGGHVHHYDDYGHYHHTTVHHVVVHHTVVHHVTIKPRTRRR